jgi:hypothetical protein
MFPERSSKTRPAPSSWTRAAVSAVGTAIAIERLGTVVAGEEHNRVMRHIEPVKRSQQFMGARVFSPPAWGWSALVDLAILLRSVLPTRVGMSGCIR